MLGFSLLLLLPASGALESAARGAARVREALPHRRGDHVARARVQQRRDEAVDQQQRQARRAHLHGGHEGRQRDGA